MISFFLFKSEHKPVAESRCRENYEGGEIAAERLSTNDNKECSFSGSYCHIIHSKLATCLWEPEQYVYLTLKYLLAAE